jgi:hypothetical protein
VKRREELLKRARTALAVTGTIAALGVALCFCFYPAFTLLGLTRDEGGMLHGQPTALPAWFKRTARSYQSWAEDYLETRRAEQLDPSDVAGTEWPLFGTVFFLMSAEELITRRQLELDPPLRTALELAARVVVDPSTASWVRAKWGDDYLTRENVFYRMLVVLGLNSYERSTGDVRYHNLYQGQARGLAAELRAAPYHLADDYPGECYPVDVLWAVVAIQRALGSEAEPVKQEVLATLDGVLRTRHGLPAFSVNARTAEIYEAPRGSGNSGILSLAGELDPAVAKRWYAAYARHYWMNTFVKGFRETPEGGPEVMNVDSGPVLLGMGSVASLFGIGAARANGRFDHASTLSLQVLAASWPTPFGLLIPGVMGWLAADGWCFGELALSFALTRPTYASETTSHDGSVPPLLWLVMLFQLALGAGLVAREVVYWRRRWRLTDNSAAIRAQGA